MNPRVLVGVFSALLVPQLAVAQTEDAAPEPTTTAQRSDGSNHIVVRLAILGAYRWLYDVNMIAPGVEASLGEEGEWAGGFVNIYGLHGSTLAGLPFTQLGFTGTFEAHFGGFRVGAGGGVTTFSITRATNGETLISTGLDNFLRVGYDFFDHGPYVMAQTSLSIYNGGPDLAAVAGPTLYVGWRF